MAFDLVLTDPPWPYYGDPDKMGAAGKEYDLMSLEDICAIPIADSLTKTGAALVWATGPKLPMAVEAIRAWGLHFRNVAFVWIKTRKSDNQIIHGQGVRATFTKQNAEYVLLATKKRTGRPFKLCVENAPQVILAPRGRHSEKPKEIREQIDIIAPDNARKLEVFARCPVPGWTCIGNEIDGKDVQEALKELIC